MIAYGPKTIAAIQKGINRSFKLFWDGSIGMFIDNVLTSENNKNVLNTLLELRTITNDHEDPPVTLLHGEETQKVLKSSLVRIKFEQQEALDARKKALEDAVPEEEEEEDEEM